jgi:hypothetical protein
MQSACSGRGTWMSDAVRTPSETLMSALEECETADQVLIILRHKDDISWHTNNASRVDKLGLLDFVTTCVRQSIFTETEEK